LLPVEYSYVVTSGVAGTADDLGQPPFAVIVKEMRLIGVKLVAL